MKRMIAILMTAVIIYAAAACTSNPGNNTGTSAEEKLTAAEEKLTTAETGSQVDEVVTPSKETGAETAGEKTGTAADKENAENAALTERNDKVYTGGTPWLCSMIDGLVTEDTPTDPKDDFYLYANKDKLLSTELTDEKTESGSFVDVQSKVDQDIQKMYTEEATLRALNSFMVSI